MKDTDVVKKLELFGDILMKDLAFDDFRIVIDNQGHYYFNIQFNGNLINCLITSSILEVLLKLYFYTFNLASGFDLNTYIHIFLSQINQNGEYNTLDDTLWHRFLSDAMTNLKDEVNNKFPRARCELYFVYRNKIAFTICIYGGEYVLKVFDYDHIGIYNSNIVINVNILEIDKELDELDWIIN